MKITCENCLTELDSGKMPDFGNSVCLCGHLEMRTGIDMGGSYTFVSQKGDLG